MFWLRRKERDLEDEIRAHFDLAVDEKVASGMTRREALEAARREFGNVTRVKEITRSMWGWTLAEQLWQDVRYAVRTMRRNVGFTFATAASLAVGIGANTTVFSMVKATLLGSLPVAESNRLVSFSERDGAQSYSWLDFCDYRREQNVFSAISARFPLAPASLSGGGNPERVWGQAVDHAYFDMLEAPMQAGRNFREEETRMERPAPLIILSDGLWRRRFGADREIVGGKIVVSGMSYTVIGVAPRGFRGIDRGLIPEFWVPLPMTSHLVFIDREGKMLAERDGQWLTITARLKPGVTRAAATAAVNAIKSRLDAAYRKPDAPQVKRPIRLSPADELPFGAQQLSMLFVLLSVVTGLVLLVACANAANLLLARAAARQREIGIRLSIGAGRGRLIRQLLTESTAIALLGAIGGLALTIAATRAISRLELPIPIPFALDFTPDWRVFLYTTVVAVITGMLFGLAPTLRSTRPQVANMLRDEGVLIGGWRRWGMRNLLVIGQVTLSLVLLISAGLFLRSLKSASSIDLGMQPSQVLLMAFDLHGNGYFAEKAIQFLHTLQHRVDALPGVQSAGFVDFMPLSFGGHSGMAKRGELNAQTEIAAVSDRYFETLGSPRLRGADVPFEKPSGRLVAVVNQRLGERLFPKGDPVGQFIEIEGRRYEVAGVVANSKARTLGEDTRPSIYMPLSEEFDRVPAIFGITLLVRTAGEPGAWTEAVRREINALDPTLAVFNAETMNDHVEKALLLPRICGALFGVFGLCGLLLASIGLYGVMSYAVRRRTHEIGVRMALGASAGEAFLQPVARQGVALVAVGLLAGLAIAVAVSRFAAGFLYGVSATDRVTFLGIPAILLAVALIAVILPARRAARVDPLAALRYE